MKISEGQERGPTFLVLLGPSGVGKSTQMEAIPRMDERFVRVRAYTTRPERVGETEKISIGRDEFEAKESAGQFAVVNTNHGHLYGTPLQFIVWSITAGRFPIMDFPWARVDELRAAFPGQVFAIYLKPTNLATLEMRLSGRADQHERLHAARDELAELAATEHPPIDAILTVDGDIQTTAEQIRKLFLAARVAGGGH